MLSYLIPNTTFLKCRKHAYFTMKKLRCRESLSYKANKWWGKDVNLGLSRSKGVTLCITK